MTPRSRRTGGSSTSTHRPDTTTRRPDTDTSRRPESTGGPGSRVEISPDNLDTMATRLSGTGGRVDAVGTTLDGISVGPQSMGIVGGTFTGAAQTHVQTAREHVTRTRAAVQSAQDGTTATATTYREREAANAASLNAIDTSTTPPNPRGATGTTPSGTTTPSSSAATPPPATGSGGTTTPSSTTTTPGPTSTPPPAVGGGGSSPPGGGGGGGGSGPPPPPGGGGGGSPTGGTPSTPTPASSSGEPWRDTIRNNFNDKDYADFERAMDKLSREPHDGEVPGTGQLTQREKDLMARAMGLIEVNDNTRMQKVIPEGSLRGYLGDMNPDGSFTPLPPGERYTDVRGFVARHQDAGVLMTPADIINGNRLDYRNSPYDTGQTHIHTMEFTAGEPTNYQRPIGAPSVYGEISGKSPEVQRHADAMMDSVERSGTDPNTYQRSVTSWPYSGAGVTVHSTMGVPEYKIDSPVPIPHGATINEYDPAGNKRVIAVYDEDWGWLQPGTTP